MLETFGQDICFIPENTTCSEAYLEKSTHGIRRLRTAKAFLVFIIFILCIINNGTCIYVFNRKQFRGKLITRLFRVVYIGNIVYIAVFTTYVFLFYSYPFEMGFFITTMSCRLLWFLMRSGVAFINWMLAIVAVLRMNMIVFPLKLMEFRSKQKNVWILLFVAFGISLLSNIRSAFEPNLTYCRFLGRTVCVINDFDWLYFTFDYFLALFVCVACSLIIFRKTSELKKIRSAQSTSKLYSPLSQMVLSSSFLFFLSSISYSLYYLYYKTESDLHCDEKYSLRFVINAVATFLLLCNNSFDATIYIIVSSSYRQIAFRGYRNCWACITRRPKRVTTKPSQAIEKSEIGGPQQILHGHEDFEDEMNKFQFTVTPEFSTEADDEEAMIRESRHKTQIWFSRATRQLLRVKRAEERRLRTLDSDMLQDELEQNQEQQQEKEQEQEV